MQRQADWKFDYGIYIYIDLHEWYYTPIDNLKSNRRISVL